MVVVLGSPFSQIVAELAITLVFIPSLLQLVDWHFRLCEECLEDIREGHNWTSAHRTLMLPNCYRSPS